MKREIKQGKGKQKRKKKKMGKKGWGKCESERV